MSIHLIIKAVELLDEAVLMTVNPVERKELTLSTKKLRKILGRKGVFIGEPETKT